MLVLYTWQQVGAGRGRDAVGRWLTIRLVKSWTGSETVCACTESEDSFYSPASSASEVSSALSANRRAGRERGREIERKDEAGKLL